MPKIGQTVEEKLVKNVIDCKDYNKMISIVKYGVNSALYLDMLIDYAVNNNNLEIIDYLVRESGNPIRCLQETLDCAIEYGKIDLIKYSNKKGIPLNYDYFLETICEKGYLDILQYTVTTIPISKLRHDRYICMASKNGHINIVKFLVENGSKFKANNHRALCLAQKNKHNEIVDYLLSQGSKFPTSKKRTINKPVSD